MRLDQGSLTLSPTDLTVYLGCAHAAALEVEHAHGRLSRPEVGSPEAEMLRLKGDEHEAAFLAELQAKGQRVVEIGLGASNFEAASAATVKAMREGHDVIFQAVFARDGWRGLADFVVRVDRPSPLGDYSYEVIDTKLARSAKPSHILQLCFYSDEIARIQGLTPEAFHVQLGSGELTSFRPADFGAYYRRLRRRFEAFVAGPPVTTPYPCPQCELCDWKPHCEKHWEDIDHLSRVAGVQRRHASRLEGAGVPTLASLARLPLSTTIPGIPFATLAKLHAQAALQHRRLTEGPLYELLPPSAGTGFALLPDASPGDLFFDIEGHPFWSVDGGLEYLWGVLDASGSFDPLWASDHVTERRAFEEFVDDVHRRYAADPAMHVYHYASYEITALRRLMGRYGTREEEVDELLRRGVFVDLYAVVRNAIRVSERNYGLKALEVFLPMARSAEIKEGGTSIVEYDRYLRTDDPRILDEIAAYNQEDCVATRLLRDWLLLRKAEAMAAYGPIPEPEVSEPRPIPTGKLQRRELREALLDKDDHACTLVAQLLDYHDRERKPVWWAFFDRLERTPEELVEDPEAIGLIERNGAPVPEKRSLVFRFSYPAQEHRLSRGDSPYDPATGRSAGEIVDIDRDLRQVSLKRGPSLAEVAPPEALLPGRPYDTPDQEDALVRIGKSLLTGDGRYPAIESLLRRTPFDRPVQTTDLDELRALVRSLDGGHLVIQGPPGSGKTWTAARLITDLVGAGKSVGVASTSHKAIHNLLDAIEKAAKGKLGFDGRKKASEGNPESFYTSANVESFTGRDEILGAQLAAGTAWLFTSRDHDGTLDYLFVDEAGQVSLADALAMGTCSRNLVLIGDPVQLPQVVQGHHPDGTAASVLEHLLGQDATVPKDRGVFLEHTFRLHPAICGYISEVFYDGRLLADDVTSTRTTPAGTGLRFLAVEHEGCRQSSHQEAVAVAQEVEHLRGLGIAAEQIMVVSPFNAQVELLRQRLPEDVPVGTVDKFQGQETDVVIYSMGASSGEDIPRGLDFLLSRNRLNVAISRARCLAYLVCSPRLLEVDCHTIDHMRLANALCRFVEIAETLAEPQRA